MCFSDHINEKINKAYSMLGIIKRNFKFMTPTALTLIYKSMVRSHLEYASSVWCPHKKVDIKNLEKVQMRATKMISILKDKSYSDRLRYLKLPSLKYRRARGDMIEVYKIISGKYDNDTTVQFNIIKSDRTRGNSYRLFQGQVKYDLRKFCFSNRIISAWNSLPEIVVTAETTNAFKNRLDRFWINQDIVYDWKAELAGIGSRS